MSELDRIDLAVHRAKVWGHRALRWSADSRDPIEPACAGRSWIDAPRIAEDRSPLWNRDVDRREWPLELGKVENLRVAARSLDGLEFAAGQRFSFWAQVGPPIRQRGYVHGRELREGCVIPGIGGGLCLLSNGLYAAARRAGMTILERHPHSRRPPGSRAALGDDATVAWNYVDLRFVASWPWRLEVELDAEWLTVAIRAGERRRGTISVLTDRRQRAAGGWVGDAGPSCRSCDQPCHYATPPSSREATRERRVWLVDEVWPEYATYLRAHGRAEDRLLLPIDGERLGVARYAWPTGSVGRREQQLVPTVLRSLRARALAEQGAARQRATLDADRRLAAAMAASLTPADTELVVSQSLVPHLQRLGALGGRRVTVLMQRLPLAELQARLDRAHQRWPASPTLADFRVDRRLIDDEARALAHAAALVSPHAELATLFPAELERVAWALPERARGPAGAALHPRRRAPGRLRLWLPASTVGRKGAWELRAALAPLADAVELFVGGRELEGPGFWPRRLLVHWRSPSLAELDAVVLPAWVEAQPRALLRAIAAGVPVLASTACGLGERPGVRTIGVGEIEPLRAAIQDLAGAR